MGPYPILLVVPSHGEPRTQVRPQRTIELAHHLAKQGATVDIVVLVERPMHVADRAKWDRVAPFCRHLWVLADPSAGSWWQRFLAWARDRVSREDLRACPAGLMTLARRTDEVSRYRTVILGAARFMPLVDVFGPGSRVFVDVARLPDVAERCSRMLGRDDALESLYPLRSDQLVRHQPSGVLVPCAQDAAQFVEWGTTVRPFVVPPIADPFAVGSEPTSRPARPPRLLFVGSETVANLDGLRWFRRRVLPLILRLVPTCRLRIVGEAGRHIQAGDDVDRIGWVDGLDREYREASLVLLPLRVGGKLRRRVVEALAHRKALALTADAAYGSGLIHREHGIVASSEESLAQGIVDILSHDAIRRRFEEKAAELAQTRFSPEAALGSIWPPAPEDPEDLDELDGEAIDPEEEAHDEDDASAAC